MKKVAVFGSTGSIGQSTLEVIRNNPNKYQVYALAAFKSVALMAQQCIEFNPQYALLVDAQAAAELKHILQNTPKCTTQVLVGARELNGLAKADYDILVAAIVGAAGLQSTLAAAQAGKTILLANKESLVMSGDLFLDAVRGSGATLLPVDSEHNAIFQSMPESVQQGGALKPAGVEKILLTGSGGPFLTKPLTEFADITPSMAVAHPNWDMGAKISVDSATMMNKGLEFIEARLLFNARFEQIQVVVHPQSIIHSMVSYTDGSVLAQMGQPDMRTPIAHTLAYPERIESGVAPLDFSQMVDFSFLAPDFGRFPNLALALEASKLGQGATTVLNAANEVAVAAFLAEKISFLDIAKVNESALNELASQSPISITDILELDDAARRFAALQVKV